MHLDALDHEVATPHEAVRALEPLAELEDPLLIAAFSGAYGSSAAATLGYLGEQWEARPVAEVDGEEFYDFTVQRPAVRLEEGARVIDWPEARFSVARPAGAGRDVVLLAGIEPNFRWRTFCEAIADTAAALGVREVVTLGAFRGPTPHTRPSPVRLHGDEDLGSRFGIAPTVSDYQGPVGIGSVLAETLRGRGLRVASMSALAPFYMGIEPEPHAVLALIEAIDRGLGTDTERERVLEQIRALDGQAQHALARSEGFRQFLQQLEEQYDQARPFAAFTPEDAEHLVRDVEEFLRGRRDLSGPGTASRGPLDRQN